MTFSQKREDKAKRKGLAEVIAARCRELFAGATKPVEDRHYPYTIYSLRVHGDLLWYVNDENGVQVAGGFDYYQGAERWVARKQKERAYELVRG